MRIFVVNLKHSVKRRELMERQLQKMGLHYEVIEAVNGHALTESEIASRWDMNVINQYASFLTKGLIGCTMSHHKVYEKMVAEKIEKALVLEDDLVLSPQLPVFLEGIENEVAINEIILCCFSSSGHITFSNHLKQQLGGLFSLAHPVSLYQLASSCSYIVPYQVAHNFVERNKPMSAAADWWNDFWRIGCFENLRCVLPMLAEPDWSLDSDLGYVDHRPVIGALKSFLHRHQTKYMNHVVLWHRNFSWKKRTAYIFSTEPPLRRPGWNDVYTSAGIELQHV